MASTLRGRSSKVHGTLGRTRYYLGIVPFSIVMLVFTSISSAVSMRIALQFAVHFGWIILIYLLLIVLFIGSYVGFGCWYVLRRGDYYSRPLTDSEYEKLKDHNLIHYTDYVSKEDILAFEKSGFLHLVANGNREANYSFLPEHRHLSFVWFHHSDRPESLEPYFKSFWNSHSSESTPRLYKVVIPFSSLSRDLMLYRPFDGAIAVIGDVIQPVDLFKEFHWYNDKVYWKHVFRFRFSDQFLAFIAAYYQLKGKADNRKVKKSL